MLSVETKWTVLRGISCSFSHDQASGNRRDQRREGQSSSLAPKAKAQTLTERYPQKGQAAEERALLEREAKNRAKIFFVESVRIRHVPCGTPPVCFIFKSESGCTCGEKCRYCFVEVDGASFKKSKKRGVKGSVALFKESKQVGCVSQDSHPRKSSLRKEGKLGSNHTVKFSKGT